MGVRRTLPDIDERRRATARTQLASSVQRLAVCHQDRGDVANDAPRLATLGKDLSADPAVVDDLRMLLRLELGRAEDPSAVILDCRTLLAG